jgi:SOS-response transcriptional repressor LexA
MNNQIPDTGEYGITGFPSACQEYAHKTLSIDEHFDLGNPSIVIIELNQDSNLFDFKKGDMLIVERGASPGHGQFVICDNGNEHGIFKVERRNGFPTIFPAKYSTDELDSVISGVIVGIIRNLP